MDTISYWFFNFIKVKFSSFPIEPISTLQSLVEPFPDTLHYESHTILRMRFILYIDFNPQKIWVTPM